MDPVKLAGELDLDFRRCCQELGNEQPWFGWMGVEDGERAEHRYRVGDHAAIGLGIVDWRHPVARAYYEREAGDEYRSVPPFRPFTGEIRAKASIVSRRRALERVKLSTKDGMLSMVAGEDGFFVEPPAALAKAGRGGGALPDIRALLTPEQYRLVASGRAQPVVIQGRAGSGKTTVALYRVAWLTYAAAETEGRVVDPGRVLVVMFNKGLESYVQSTLADLGLEGAALDTFHGWALERFAAAYAGKIEMDAASYPGADVARSLKKRIGMLTAVAAFVERQTERMLEWLSERLAPYQGGEWVERYRQAEGPVVRRLQELLARARRERDRTEGAEAARLAQSVRILEQAIKRMRLYKEELLQLLTDRELLRAHLPEVSDEELDTLASYQRHLQGRGGTARRPGPGLSFDDLALLLRILELKHGGFPDRDGDAVHLFEHVVIDEAQDFGAGELSVLLGAVRSRTGVTVVGDVNQKIRPDADFIGWDRLVEELGVEGAIVSRLEVPHRSTAPIMRVADLIGGDESAPGRPGPMPTLCRIPDPAARADQLAELVTEALAELPAAHVAVVTRHRGDVEPLRDDLAGRLGAQASVRIGYNKDWEFGPGVTVTNLYQVKGLEFDAVVVADATAEAYPDDETGRRHLYMLLTRAKSRLDLVCGDAPSPLLAGPLDTGALVDRDAAPVPEVAFTEDEDEPF